MAAITNQNFAKGHVVAGQKYYATDLITMIDSMQALNEDLIATCVNITEDQSIGPGVKTFEASPIVPDLAASDGSTKAANAKYVDAQVTAGRNTPIYDNTELQDANAPDSFADLDIATLANLTPQRMLVLLRVKTGTAGGRIFKFRPNGDTGPTSHPGGAGSCNISQNEVGYIVMMTDASGIIEWFCTTASSNAKVNLLTWQKVN